MLLREVGLQEDKGPRWFVEASNFFAAQTFLSEHGVVLGDALLQLQDMRVRHTVVDQHHHQHVMIALASIPAKEKVKVRRRSAFRIRPMMHRL